MHSPFCSDNCILIHYEPGIKVVPLPCKRWTCEPCSEINKSKVRNEAYRGRPNTFITLTVNPAIGETPSQRAQNIVEAFRKVRRKAKKGWGNIRFPFYAVFEETIEGEPHLHVLARLKWVPQDWLSDQMKIEIGAPIVDIRRIKSRKSTSRYISKYIGKDPEKFEGCKRYWRSLDYLVEPRKERKDPIGERLSMSFERGSVDDVITKYTARFYRLEVLPLRKETEYWLVSAWEGFGNSDPPPQEGSKDRKSRPAQELGPDLFSRWLS